MSRQLEERRGESDREWELPGRRHSIDMAWHELLFMHWPVEAGVLEALVPEGLEVDTFDGAAWLGIVPFRMTGVRHRGLPSCRRLSDFLELNVRTYVTRDDKPGVWFFTLDAAQPVAVWVARRTFHLPYYRARMASEEREGWFHYRSTRTHRSAPPAEFAARYRPDGDVFHTQPGTLEHFFTARYCLYTADRRGRLYRGEIDHEPWPLQPAAAELERSTMAEALGIRLPDAPPRLHFARTLQVRAWSLDRVG